MQLQFSQPAKKEAAIKANYSIKIELFNDSLSRLFVFTAFISLMKFWQND